MNHFGSTDPPRTLTKRLRQLSDNLQALGEGLKASIARIVGDAIADAVRDCVHHLLGSKEPPVNAYREYRDPHAHAQYRDGEDDPWGEEDRPWEHEEVYSPKNPGRQTPANSNRWRIALSGALQAALWFMKQRPRRFPILTTLGVTLAAGVTAFVAGPALAAGAGVLASVAGLMLTANAAKSAAELASG